VKASGKRVKSLLNQFYQIYRGWQRRLIGASVFLYSSLDYHAQNFDKNQLNEVLNLRQSPQWTQIVWVLNYLCFFQFKIASFWQKIWIIWENVKLINIEADYYEYFWSKIANGATW